ncbi:MAG: tyrosine recombinase [Erysipelotrichaceae bacterium]
MLIEEAIKHYVRYLKVIERKAHSTLSSYENDLRQYQTFLSAQGITQVEQIGEKTVQYYLEQATGAKSSLNHRISVLCSFHRFIFIEYQIANPTLKLHSVKAGLQLPHVLSKQQVNRLLEGIEATDFLRKAIFELLYGSGLRISEVCNLQYHDVFLEQGFIKFMGKGNKQRMLPINKMTKTALQDYFMYQRPTQDKYHAPYCFLSKRGNQLTRQAIHNMVKYEAAKQGLSPQFSTHSLRHAFATHLIDGGADLRVVQELLGHENIATTQIYTHVQSEQLRATYDSFHPRNKEKENEEI